MNPVFPEAEKQQRESVFINCLVFNYFSGYNVFRHHLQADGVHSRRVQLLGSKKENDKV